MLKIVKFGGLTVAAGVLVGGSVVAWLSLQAEQAPLASTKSGSVSLNPSPTPAADSANPLALRVYSPGAVAEAGGAANTLLPSGQSGGSVSGTNGSGGGSGTSDGSSSGGGATVPSPDNFAQYDKYRDEQAALFGDIKQGDGAAVAVGSTVTVQYRGWLTNGTMFDESYSKSAGFSFKEGEHRVIVGWEQGLLGMKVGGKRRLIVPPSAGYGAEAHSVIPGNSVLVFDIELLDVR